MNLTETIKQAFSGAPEVSALFMSGAAGAYARAVFAPQASWKRRLSEGLAGAFSAIFIGGFLGHQIDRLTDAGSWAYLAAGFIMGEGGITAVRGFRKFILKESDK